MIRTACQVLAVVAAPLFATPPTDADAIAARDALLALASDTAAALPHQPHIKNRSRAQELVVDTCLALDLPKAALRESDRIDNWRRGLGYASCALYMVRSGTYDEAEVLHLLDVADQLAALTEDWRRDRIRTHIAATLAWLGRRDEAAKLEEGVEPSEGGRVLAVEAARAGDDEFDRVFARVQALASTGDFESVRTALIAGVRLHDRFYASAARRARIEVHVRSSWAKLPPQIQIELLLELGDNALGHGDQDGARRLAGDARGMLEDFRASAETSIALAARIASLRGRAGDTIAAATELTDALKRFDAQQKYMLTIDRADVLRGIAGGFADAGDPARALAVYRQAVEAGVVNPNSRPRAMDLSATCCAMARHGIAPDDELMARMREIRKGLGDPW